MQSKNSHEFFLLLKVLKNLSDPAAVASRRFLAPSRTLIAIADESIPRICDRDVLPVKKPQSFRDYSLTINRNAPRPPAGMSSLIRDETGEESSGSSTLVAQEGGLDIL